MEDVATKIAAIRNRASQLGLQVQDNLVEGGNALSVKIIGHYGERNSWGSGNSIGSHVSASSIRGSSSSII